MVMNTSLEEVANNSKTLGILHFNEQNYGRAFAHLLLALRLKGEWKSDLRSLFELCLCEWGKQLETEERYENLFQCYKEALEVFSQNEVILNNLGAHLIRLNQYKEAARYFRESLSINNHYLPAFRNLQNVSNLVVERWHYRMLNDIRRNEAFKNAIKKKINEGFRTVIDIGTGTGLLSLYAAEGGASKIYACDYSEVMVSLAIEIIEKNGLSDKIKVINKLSKSLIIPEDIPERVSCVVTETMDAGLLGEHLLETLVHAWDCLLLPQTSLREKRVVPHGAKLFLLPVESITISCKHKITSCGKSSSFLHMPFLLTSHNNEPYDTLNINNIPYKSLSEPIQLYSFDFNNPEELKQYISGEKDSFFQIEVSEEGYLDACVVWFDLFLDNKEFISSSPKHISCWDQAIFPVKDKIYLKKKESIFFKVRINEGALSIDNFRMEIKSEKDMCNTKHHFFVSNDLLRFVNNEYILKELNNFNGKLKNMPLRNLKVLDMLPYPHVGLQMLKNNAEITFSPKDEDFDFFLIHCKENINRGEISLISREELPAFLTTKKNTFDVLILDLLDPKGEFDEQLISLLPVLRESVHKDNNFQGIIYPSQVSVYCQLVNSSWLLNCSKFCNSVLEEEYIGLDILNDFQVEHMIDLDKHDIKNSEIITNEAKVALFEVSHLVSDELLEFKIQLEALKEGEVNAIIYWFGFGDKDNEILSNTTNFYINLAAQVLTSNIKVFKGDVLSVALIYNNGVMKFSLETS